MRKIIIPALIFFLTASTAFARDGGPETREMWTGSARATISNIFHKGNETGEHREGMGSSTRATSTTPREQKDEKGHASTTPEFRGVPGVITSVGTTSFTMALPGNKEHATTTVTVNVTSSTTYKHASSTAVFSDLAVGSHVVVLGKVSTSNKTITAERVMIGGDVKLKQKIEEKGIKNVFNHLRNFFKGKHEASTSADAEVHADSAAAVEAHTSVGVFFRKLFGWL